MADVPRPFFDHLNDLRDCLIKGLLGWLAASAVCFQYCGHVLDWLTRPPLQKLVFTSPAEPFLAYFKVAAFLGLLIAFPWLLLQTWTFISVALKPGEKKVFWELIPVSYALFLGGAALGVFIVVPTAMRFLFTFATDHIVPYITLNAYLSFVGYVSVGLGLFFQFPIVLFVLGSLGMITPQTFSGYRRHVFLGLLIGSALVSSGSIVDQVMIAVPAYVLFEATLLLMRFRSAPAAAS